MTSDELFQFWLPARSAVMGAAHLSGLSASEHLAELLGLNYSYLGYWTEIEFTPELRRKLELLAGVHSNTIRKILEVRKEVHHDRR